MHLLKNTSGFLLFAGLLLLTSSRRIQKESITRDPRLYATAWFAASAEKQAIYQQIYQMAGAQLPVVTSGGKPKALVADLDETVLDNSAWSLRILLEGKDYPAYWDQWEKAAAAPAFPGAVDFFKQAASNGLKVFYVSNRSQKNLGACIRNLRSLGLPFADSAHVLLKETTSSKIARRAQIEKDYEIILLLGDNLADFDGAWEKADVPKRAALVKAAQKDWGKKFILFPNPMYGSWEDAIMGNRYDLNEFQQDSAWTAVLDACSKVVKW